MTRTVTRHVLSIEDNPADSLILRTSFERHAKDCTIQFIEDGEEALNYLFRRGQWTVAKRPSLILLDLNLPRRSGREILTEIKKNPDLDFIPVVVLSTTTNPTEVRDLHRRGVSAVLTKPVDYNQVEKILESLFTFWLDTAHLPATPF